MPSVGEDFGDYRIDGVLGRGGMGVVYRAWQRRVGRPVALKVLAPAFAGDPEYRGRFGREAAALARLDSPHVIQIHDHGEVGGSLYLAMQLVNGPDLATVLQSGPLPPQRALPVVAQVAAALGDAHAIGIVHRDVKPGNVLLRARAAHDVDDFAYLCDFGIARDAADGASSPTVGVVGTVGYLAPERFDGAPATPSSDVYALGCLLWATLTGRQPYTGSQPQVIMAHMHAPPPQLVVEDARTVEVNALLAAMLAKDPAARPAVAAVRDRIRGVLGAGPMSGPSRVAAVAETSAPPRRRPSRRLLLALGAGVAALAVGAAVLPGVLAGDPAAQLAAATPAGIACSPVAPPDGVRAEVLCRPGPGGGDLRISALGGAGAAREHLRTGAGQDPDALPGGECPADLPARQSWERDGHGGTLLCFTVGTGARYAWTDDEHGTVSVLDGPPDQRYPLDLPVLDAAFRDLRY